MVTVSYCDERLRGHIASGRINLFYYSPKGQEAIAAGVAAALERDDYLVTTYRGLHDVIAKGVPLRPLLAEYLGRATGLARGKGGPMHVSDLQHGVAMSTGIVGAGLPIANGLALAAQYSGSRRVTVCSFGDGATNIGAFHEALTLAGIWKLPIVFVCQNNQYGEYTPREATQSVRQIADFADAYGMPGVTVDGNDPVGVFSEVEALVERARKGDGPALLECITFRFYGHFVGDPMPYIERERLENARAADPTALFRTRLLKEEGFSEADIDQIDQESRAEVDQALTAAMEAPAPMAAELDKDVVGEAT
jgi:TPP-dependent pyruvate/acetoin dehydrogenase alpha subunit